MLSSACQGTPVRIPHVGIGQANTVLYRSPRCADFGQVCAVSARLRESHLECHAANVCRSVQACKPPQNDATVTVWGMTAVWMHACKAAARSHSLTRTVRLPQCKMHVNR